MVGRSLISFGGPAPGLFPGAFAVGFRGVYIFLRRPLLIITLPES